MFGLWVAWFVPSSPFSVLPGLSCFILYDVLTIRVAVDRWVLCGYCVWLHLSVPKLYGEREMTA